jgi:hypothetical protein
VHLFFKDDRRGLLVMDDVMDRDMIAQVVKCAMIAQVVKCAMIAQVVIGRVGKVTGNFLAWK